MAARLSRRHLLAASVAAMAVNPARARIVKGSLPWSPGPGSPPTKVEPGPWQFFTAEEGAAVEAIVDRVIPPDPQWAGGKDAGCAVFLDRQLAGGYGESRGLYMRPPFQDGTKEQGDQSPLTPAQRYRQSLAALDKHCRAAFAGKPFAQIPDDQKDKLLAGMEKGDVQFDGGPNARGFFDMVVKDTQEGFFADPVYGGNRDMVAWRMIGFAGARYDYRDWVDQHNKPYPLPPVGITGRPEWTKGAPPQGAQPASKG